MADIERIKRKSKAAAATALVFAASMAAGDLLGFYEGRIHGVSWEAGVAVAAGFVLTWYGAAGVLIGFMLGRLFCGYFDILAVWEASTYAAASIASGLLMRRIAHQRERQSFTFEWLGFFAGVSTFTSIVSIGVLAGLLFMTDHSSDYIASVMTLTVIIEPLGAASVGAILAKRAEFKTLARIENPLSVLGAAAITAFLVTLVAIVLERLGRPEASSTIIILLALPISVWLAFMPHSLPGAIISMLGFQSALWIVLNHHGSPLHHDYALIAAAYLVLVISFQLVHALHLDRLAALATLGDRRDELERRVSERTSTLQEMAKRAVAADRAKSEFLARMSHELRTPLNGVIGMSDVLLSSPIDEDAKSSVRLIHKSGIELLRMIESVLDHATLGAPTTHQEPCRSGPMNVAEIVQDVVFEIAATAPPHLSLTTKLDAGLPKTLLGDGQGLYRVLSNLLSNAVKFTSEGGVEVAVRRIGAQEGGVGLRISVSDTGAGVAPKDRERIFEPFEQVDGSETRSAGGVGLGLTICREIVERMGGVLTLESEPERGSTFSFDLVFAESGKRAA